jgi:hypothetical protein
MADLALAIVAGTVGAMVFFGAIVAPTAFGTLGEQQAGQFIRALFPRYYLLFSATSFAACATALIAGGLISAILLGLAGTGFVYARSRLMPAINQARDQGSTRTFERLHRRSVRLNMAQLAGLLVAAVSIAFGL